jgi:hypothetical protein
LLFRGELKYQAAMSLYSQFDYVEVTFHGGPHDGTVSLSASEIASHRTPTQTLLAGICSLWRAAQREDTAFTGTVLLLPAVSAPQPSDRLANHGQDLQVRYRVDWVDLRDNGTLKLILKYLAA